LGGGGSGTSNPSCTADCNPGDIPPPPPPAIPPAQVPAFQKVLCGAEKYGSFPKRYPTNFLNIFQFGKDLPNGGMTYAWSYASNVPPVGYHVTYATPINPNPMFPNAGSTLSASGVQPFNGSVTYIPPGTTAQTTQNRNYNAMEHAVMTAGHEFAHQSGVHSERTAEGFGVAAADAYKADHGAKCP